MKASIDQIMSTSPVIPVIVIDDISQACPLAEALVAGGLKVLEVTLRTDCALEAMELIAKNIPDAIVGAGTVTTPQQVSDVVNAGAQFMVSPGSTDALIDAALASPIEILPGVATASEAMRLRERGITRLKFFPAEAAGGAPMLKSLAGPLSDLIFCPTGGITPALAPEYLKLPNVACVGGSWMVPKNLVNAGDWDAITKLAKEAAEITT
ncbi:bifunctional 4-hydroxy-2-oxoglutarate aldolase/2-dehydro-3-deoxy-phosphogluconate aldolase [Sessilibacter corallicola]|uniref:2-dehydro-3-deoxy-phosphogluconate aldolase n=1 Tax=Sessilibacter corallicola TaxID=2904075 RepID=A0ABQ0ACK8_9GAMM|nr:bifunctional 4-hydroxy-2-oxoglutarate aldolase/2-dehydro-3-deoxy-phosphogluconate aldolase [Sessilibacter corallicola]